jgi:hypothetical protein
MGSIAGRFGTDPARVIFKDGEEVVPLGTVVDQLALQPRTPIAVEIEQIRIKVVHEQPDGDVRRIVSVVCPTVEGILGAIGGRFGDPRWIVLVQRGVVLEESGQLLTDLSARCMFGRWIGRGSPGRISS